MPRIDSSRIKQQKQQNGPKNDLQGVDLPIDVKIDNLSVWSQYGRKPNEMKLPTIRKKNSCAACKSTEKTAKFKCCLRCLQVHIPMECIAFYCSEECQSKHWKYHRFEHKLYESNDDLFDDCLLKNGDKTYTTLRNIEIYNERYEQRLQNKRHDYEQALKKIKS